MCFWLRVRGFSALGFAWLWRCVGFRAVLFRAFSTVYRGLCGLLAYKVITQNPTKPIVEGVTSGFFHFEGRS